MKTFTVEDIRKDDREEALKATWAVLTRKLLKASRGPLGAGRSEDVRPSA